MEERRSKIISKIIGEVTIVIIQTCFRFYTTLDWEDVYHKRLKPPIVPFEPKYKQPEGDSRTAEELSERRG